MKMKQLGRSGLRISELGLGTMTFGKQTDENTAYKIMDLALEAGVNLFDCADIYPLGGGVDLAGHTEAIVGKWAASHRREELVITSKCYAQTGAGVNENGLSRLHVLNAIDASLRRLKTTYIDLYMAHAFDERVPIEETVRAYEDAVLAGKIRYWGVSNWRSWQIVKALGIQNHYGYVPIISDQLRYNLLFRRPEDDIFPMCRSEKIGIMAYNPLAGGLLTGKYNFGAMPTGDMRFNEKVGSPLYTQRYWNEWVFEAVTKYISCCNENGRNPVTMAIQWVMQQEAVSTTLIGASKPGQLTDSLRATDTAPLTADELEALGELWYCIPRSKDEQVH